MTWARPALFMWLGAALGSADEYLLVPGSGGAVLHESCVKEVPPGVIADDSFDLRCGYPALYPNEQVYAMDVHTDGSDTYEQMNSSWTVPQLPAKTRGQTVFFWPGFKATQPEPGYPVLQPVLQYGQHPGEVTWHLKSWFVWAKHHLFPIALTGPAIPVSPGDHITSYMDYNDAAKVWTVYGKNMATGNESKLQVSHSKMKNLNFTYAMHVLETVMPASGYCGDYPQSDAIEFTGISANHGERLQWLSRTGKTDCHQKVTAAKDGSDVKFTWATSGAELLV